MSDPQRLLDGGSKLEAELLSAAPDDAPPPHLLSRTLSAVGVALPVAPVPAKLVAKAGTAGASGAGLGAGASGAGGGLLGAAAIGALAGVLAVGSATLARRQGEPAARPVGVYAATTSASAASAPSAAPTPSASARSAPIEERPRAEVTGAPSGGAPVTSASGPRAATLQAELSLLDEARAALHQGEPGRARAILDRYAREIPRGQMAREAALLRAEAEAAIDAGRTNP